MAYAITGRPGAQGAYAEGQFGWRTGVAGEPGGDPRVLRGSPVAETQSRTQEGNEDLLRSTEQSDTIRAGLRIIWHHLQDGENVSVQAEELWHWPGPWAGVDN